MSIEVATYVGQLSQLDPPGGDPKSQGDDHIRLIKSTLKNTFPNGTRPLRGPEWITKTTHYSIALEDDQKTILCNPATFMQLTLPIPTYSGWTIRILNVGSQVVVVVPSSGNITGLARARCSVPFVEYIFVWTGTEFYRVKSAGEVPPGTIEWSANPGIPTGFSLANGQALGQFENPELFAVWGGTYGAAGAQFNCPNLLDRFIVAAGNGYGLAALGGETLHTLSPAEMPAHAHGGSTGGESVGHTHDYQTAGLKTINASGFNTSGGTIWGGGNVGAGSSGISVGHTHAISTDVQGGNAAHENRPPFFALYPIFRQC